MESTIGQGDTTEFAGHCGLGVAPVPEHWIYMFPEKRAFTRVMPEPIGGINPYGFYTLRTEELRDAFEEAYGERLDWSSYLLYARAINNCGRRLVDNTLLLRGDHYEVDFDDLEAKMRDPRNRLMLLCNPHNPTMDVWDRAALRRIAAMAKRHHVLVVTDEIYAEHVWSPAVCVPYSTIGGAGDNCVVCTSIGKAFNFTGTSHANIIVPNGEIREKYILQRDADHYGSQSPFMRAAVLGAYTPEGKAWIDALLEFVGENERIVRAFFAEVLPQARALRHTAGTLLWVDCRAVGDEDAVAARFRAAGVEPDCGSKYGESGRGFFRLQIGMPRAELCGALERLRREFA